MRGRLAAVAATVIDGETASRCAKNGSPARDPEPSSQRRLPLVALVPGSFLGRTMMPSTLLGLDDGTHCDAKRLEQMLQSPARRN